MNEHFDSLDSDKYTLALLLSIFTADQPPIPSGLNLLA